MGSKKRHPYLTKEFWEQNRFWDNQMHGKHSEYEERINNIINSFRVKEDNIFNRMKKNN